MGESSYTMYSSNGGTAGEGGGEDSLSVIQIMHKMALGNSREKERKKKNWNTQEKTKKTKKKGICAIFMA